LTPYGPSASASISACPSNPWKVCNRAAETLIATTAEHFSGWVGEHAPDAQTLHGAESGAQASAADWTTCMGREDTTNATLIAGAAALQALRMKTNVCL
jgi:hypothetical protein